MNAGHVQPPVPVLPRSRRPRTVRPAPVAVAAIAALTVAAWIAAPALRPAPAPSAGEPSLVPSSRFGAVAGTPSAAAPTPRPSFEWLSGPQPRGLVYLRDSGGVAIRSLDLANGTLGERIGPASWPDALLALPDGSFVCVCLARTDERGESRVTIALATAEEAGLGRRTDLLTAVGREDADILSADQGESVNVSSAVSTDGRLVAIGLSVRRPPVWHRSVALVEVATRRVVQTVRLDDAPSRDAPPFIGPRWASAPRVLFAPDDRHVAITLEQGRQADSEPRPSTLLVADLSGDRMGQPMTLPAPTPDSAAPALACASGTLGFASPTLAYGACWGSAGTTAVLVADVVRRMSRLVSLGDSPPTWGASVFDPRSGSLYIWDPFGGRIARVDVAAARLVAAATIASATATVAPLDALRRAIATWIAPTAAAKLMLEPALAISDDGTRLYVVAANGGMTEAATTTTIHVLDAATLVPLDTWSADPDIVSIAVHADALLVASIRPPDGQGGSSEAAVTVRDGANGDVRAVIRGLGDDWPMFVDPPRISP